MNTITQEIIKRTSNIGSLVLYLKNNREYLDYIHSNIPESVLDRQMSEKIYYLVNGIKSPLNCKCGNHLKFIGFKNGYRKTCGEKECFVNSRKESCIDKWGVDNPKKSKEIIEKERESILDRWGGKHFMMDDSVRNKFKETMIDKWGVEWSQQNNEIKSKSNKTWFDNPDREEIIFNRKEKIKNKTGEEKLIIQEKKELSIIKTFSSLDNFYKYRLSRIGEASLLKWGKPHHFQSEEIIKKRVEKYKDNITNRILDSLPANLTYIKREPNKNITDMYIFLNCNKCNSDFEITRQLFSHRKSGNVEICLGCNPIHSGKSGSENEVYSFISSIYSGEVIQGFRLDNKEIDIYLPHLKIGFEFNGVYWHSNLYKENNFHLNKTKFFQILDISLIHIWEDDWAHKRDIIKSIISNKIGLTTNRIGARKCQIREVDNNLVRDFLNGNHIQGFVGSKVKLGLFYEDELVSLMTFGNLRRSLGQKSKGDHWELLRFCNKLNTQVIGGASKLFRYFLKNFVVGQIISFCDYSRSTGELYKKIGFNFSHLSQPNYYYVIDGIRKHRFNFRKDKLVKSGADSNLSESKIMSNLGYYRIYDCGMQKWVFNI